MTAERENFSFPSRQVPTRVIRTLSGLLWRILSAAAWRERKCLSGWNLKGEGKEISHETNTFDGAV